MELPYLGTALWLNRDFAPAAVTAIQIEKQDHLLGKMRAAEKWRLVLGAELSGNSKKNKTAKPYRYGNHKNKREILDTIFYKDSSSASKLILSSVI